MANLLNVECFILDKRSMEQYIAKEIKSMNAMTLLSFQTLLVKMWSKPEAVISVILLLFGLATPGQGCYIICIFFEN